MPLNSTSPLCRYPPERQSVPGDPGVGQAWTRMGPASSDSTRHVIGVKCVVRDFSFGLAGSKVAAAPGSDPGRRRSQARTKRRSSASTRSLAGSLHDAGRRALHVARCREGRAVLAMPVPEAEQDSTATLTVFDPHGGRCWISLSENLAAGDRADRGGPDFLAEPSVSRRRPQLSAGPSAHPKPWSNTEPTAKGGLSPSRTDGAHAGHRRSTSPLGLGSAQRQPASPPR